MRAKPDSEIPEFESIQEEAEFWDTHDTTEFLDEFEEADNVVFVPFPLSPVHNLQPTLRVQLQSLGYRLPIC